jgi:hypothetical protein
LLTEENVFTVAYKPAAILVVTARHTFHRQQGGLVTPANISKTGHFAEIRFTPSGSRLTFSNRHLALIVAPAGFVIF